MASELSAAALALLNRPEFATIATIEPDGQPQLSVVWVRPDGGDILCSTVVGRRKERNLARDPRVTVLVCPRDNPYSYLEVRGTATLSESGGRELIDELASKYTGAERYTMDDGTDSVRVIVRISPHHVVERGL